MKKQQFQPLTPAAVYARMSSDHQEVGLSITAQLRALRDYAERYKMLFRPRVRGRAQLYGFPILRSLGPQIHSQADY